MFKKIFQIVSADTVFKAVSFLLIPFYLFWMPKVEYAEFTFLYTVFSTLPLLLSLSLYTPLMKFSSASELKEEKLKFYFSTANFVFLFCLIILILFSLIGAQNFILENIFNVVNYIDIKWLLILLIVIFSSVNLVHFAHVVTFQNAQIVIKYNALKVLLLNLLSVIFLYSGFHDDTVILRLLGVACGELVLSFICFFWFGKGSWIFSIDIAYIKMALKFAAPLIPSGIVAMLIAASDRYFLSANYGNSYLAEYNLAIQFLVPISLIIIGAQAAISPSIYSNKNAQDSLNKSITYYFVLIVVFACASLLLALTSYLGLEFGFIPSSYQNIVFLILILAFPVSMHALLGIVYNLFIRADKPMWVLCLSSFNAFLLIVGGSIFIPIYGYVGAAINASIIYIVISIIGYFMASSLSKNNI